MKKLIYAFVLDKSGSMGSIRKETLEGINTQIDSIKKNNERGVAISASLLQFDTNSFEWTFKNVPAEELQPLSWEQYQPYGSTPLNDAVAAMVEYVQSLGVDDETNIVVPIFTDGYENASSRFTTQQIKQMIEELSKDERWTFTFVGCGGLQEVQNIAASYSISSDNVLAYSGTPEGALHAYNLMAASITGCTTRMTMGLTARSKDADFYSAAENFAG